MEEFSARGVDAFVSVGAKIVALGLEEVLGEACGAIAVEVGEGGGECGSGDAVFCAEGYDFAPIGLSVLDSFLEIGV